MVQPNKMAINVNAIIFRQNLERRPTDSPKIAHIAILLRDAFVHNTVVGFVELVELHRMTVGSDATCKEGDLLRNQKTTAFESDNISSVNTHS